MDIYFLSTLTVLPGSWSFVVDEKSDVCPAGRCFDGNLSFFPLFPFEIFSLSLAFYKCCDALA